MKRTRRDAPSRRLIDHVVGDPTMGPPRALLATTFDLTPEFFELDILPSFLRIPASDDRRIKARVQLEAELAKMDSLAVLMEATRYQGRPRSLLVHVTPASPTNRGVLHAKVTLIVHDDAVRLIVSSANLTSSGYRENREVALALVATRKAPAEGALIRQALAPMPELLSAWWSESAQTVVTRALEKLALWDTGDQADDEWFVWGGGKESLLRQVTQVWPDGEAVRRITVVSPFWSDEGPDGPIARLLGALQERNASVKGARIQLVTAAAPDTTRTWLPKLPPSYATFDFRTLGVVVSAVPAKPQVDAEDVGRDDILRERCLHAKVLLIEGPSTAVAYFGSANFTVSGWSLGRREGSNIEAGVIVRRRGKQRSSLDALIPPTVGESVRLEGRGKVALAALEPDAAKAPWPWFLESAELCPSPEDSTLLELRLRIAKGEGAQPWSMALEPAGELVLSHDASTTEVEVLALGADTLGMVLRNRSVYVRWPALEREEPVAFPVNVSLSARANVPFGDADALPRENDLVAFYQGRIAIEDLFAEPDEDEPRGGGHEVPIEDSSVDTSKILSYQIRSFVEALPGLCEEIARNTATAGTIRLALLGPVSPVALAREIEKAAVKGRSPVAVGFQLIELLRCLAQARHVAVQENVQRAWEASLAEAEAKVGAALARLREKNPQLSMDPFQHYARAVLPPQSGVEVAS